MSVGETHWERLCALLDDEALDQVCEDVGLDYRLGCFGFSIESPAVVVAAADLVVVVVVVGSSISRGHDWSDGRHPVLSTGNTGAKFSHLDPAATPPTPTPPPASTPPLLLLQPDSCCTNTQSMQRCSLMFQNVLAWIFKSHYHLSSLAADVNVPTAVGKFACNTAGSTSCAVLLINSLSSSVESDVVVVVLRFLPM